MNLLEKLKARPRRGEDHDLIEQFFVTLDSIYQRMQQRISFTLSDESLENIANEGVPQNVIDALGQLKDRLFTTKESFLQAVGIIEGSHISQYKDQIFEHAQKSRYLDQFPDLATEINRLLTGEKNWQNAYHIEQLMIPLFSEEELEVEVQRRLVEAENHLSDKQRDFYMKNRESDAQNSISGQRALLQRLVDDLQWRYAVRQRERHYGSLAQIKTSFTFIMAIILFFLFTFDFEEHIPLIGAMTAEITANIGQTKQYLLIAIGAGLMGAAFSMLIGLKDRLENSTLDELRVARKWTYIFSRVTIGMGAAFILFYFLQSQIIEGPLLPQFASMNTSVKGAEAFTEKIASSIEGEGELQVAINGFVNSLPNESGFNKESLRSNLQNLLSGEIQHVDDKNLALIIVFCFLAGFSEKLVPNLLSKTEGRLGNTKQKDD